MSIHSNLSALMGKFRYTMQEVHELTGLSRTTIATLYYDRVKRIDYDTLEKLCRLFGCTVGDLIEFMPAKLLAGEGTGKLGAFRGKEPVTFSEASEPIAVPAGRPFRILTDSCSDLTGQMLEKSGISYAHMNTVCEGKETPASLTWEYYSPKEFYDHMRNEKGPSDRITTTQVPPEEFRRIFEEAYAAGEDVLYLACSSALTGSGNTARIVAEEFLGTHGGMQIVTVDTLNSSIGEGMLVMYACELKQAGKSLAEIAADVTARRKNVLQYVTVHTLDYLKRAGRVKASAAFFGNLMGVKPILVSDVNGANAPIKKVKGRAASLSELIRLAKENMTDPETQTVYLVNADCDASELEAFRVQVQRELGCREVVTLPIGPIVGASVGPDTVGLFAFGKQVTFEG